MPEGSGQLSPYWRSPSLWRRLFTALILGVSVVGIMLPACGACDELSISELLARTGERGRTIESFRIKASVCAAEHGRNLVVLQDDSGAVIVELPGLNNNLEAGDRVEIQADHCMLTRSRFGIQFGTAPVVNNDGHHPAITKSGDVFLEAGFQPIQVTWFNGDGPSALDVSYEGPGMERRKVPDSALWHKISGAQADTGLQPGLDFAAFTGDWLFTLPDFRHLTPVANGVATNFDLRYSVRPGNSALAFNGFIKIPISGTYTFYLTSDDGAYLYAGDPTASCKVTVLQHKNIPVPVPFEDAVAKERDHLWAQVEGQVTFVSQDENALELEVAGKGEPVQAAIVDGELLFSANLLNRRVRLSGIQEYLPELEPGHRARLVVPGAEQVKLDPYDESSASKPPNKLLTTAREIRHLPRTKASQRLPAKIKGVVTWSSPYALTLQDDTGGVYIHYGPDDWTAHPRVGDCWDIEGLTSPGDFSPVLFASAGKFLGNAPFPEPIRPTWDQVLNGSLDAEYVELRGALTEISPSELTLLTSGGKIKILASNDHPLPYLAPLPNEESYVDSIVRIRGCLTAHWDMQTHHAIKGDILLSPATVEIEEVAPKNPFGIPGKRVSDWLLFDPNPNVPQRAKFQGQIVLAAHGEYFLQDGTAGLRLRTREPVSLQPGDQVDAVGFLQFGGPIPVLQEARVRTNGTAPLPAPVPIAGAELRNAGHDATRVQVEAVLVNDRKEGQWRVLEMQAGQNHFLARLTLQAKPDWQPIAAGSLLRLTGVYVGESDEKSGGNLDAFELSLNSAADIEILRQASWWTVRRALAIVGALSGFLGLAAIWITLLRQKVKERTMQLEKEIEERQLVEQRRLVERERTRVAQDLHDELGAGLTEVGLLGDLAKNPIVPGYEKQQYLGQLTEIARSLVTSLDAIVWAINPRYDSAASLASYYTLFAQRFLNLAGVACRPEIPASFPESPLDPKTRHGLFLAFKEALNNVVRHADATEVRLKIDVREDELIIIVADNGSGMQLPPNVPEREGLPGMRRRMEQLGGGCSVRSQPGKGTEVELRLPVGDLLL